MTEPSHYLAIDLGAESGRAVHATFQSGSLRTEEIHRFRNEPVRYNGELHWDTPRLWLEVQRALASISPRAGGALRGVGVDTWGADFALLGENGALLDNPFHYRDSRTIGMIEQVCKIIPANTLYSRTGIQFLEFNTLFQLYAAFQRTPRLISSARHLITMADLLNYWLTGEIACEYTNATTTQLIDARSRAWAADLLSALGLPTALPGALAQPGTRLGRLRKDVAGAAGLDQTPVFLPGCHDTASAVAAINLTAESVFISSGTWSLMGVERPDVIINENARRLNFTNEGGVCGTIRFLKNVSGLWLVQQCANQWQTVGQTVDYGELAEMARMEVPLRSLIDPDHASFMRPTDMPAAITAFCRRTNQPAPEGQGALMRTMLDSLALKYRYVLEDLEMLTERTYREIRIVGGGARNAVLNQATADATGRRVVAGPIEATALGNIALQLVASGAVESLCEARSIIDRSYPTKVFTPGDPRPWDRAYTCFRQYCEQ